MTVDVAASRPVQFSIGRTIATSVRIFGHNFLLFMILAMAIRMIWWLAPPRAATTHTDTVLALEWSRDFARPLVGLMVSSLTQAAMVVGTLRGLQGQRALINDAIQGLSFLLSIAVGSAIVWVSGMAPQLIGSALEQALGGSQSIAGAVVGVLAALVLTIPAIIVTIACSILAPAIVAEQIGIFAALARSFQLTKGRRWSMVGLFVIMMVAMALVIIVVSKASGVSSWEIVSPTAFTMTAVVGHVLMSLISAFGAVQLTVAYACLRADKEGIRIEDVANPA